MKNLTTIFKNEVPTQRFSPNQPDKKGNLLIDVWHLPQGKFMDSPTLEIQGGQTREYQNTDLKDAYAHVAEAKKVWRPDTPEQFEVKIKLRKGWKLPKHDFIIEIRNLGDINSHAFTLSRKVTALIPFGFTFYYFLGDDEILFSESDYSLIEVKKIARVPNRDEMLPSLSRISIEKMGRSDEERLRLEETRKELFKKRYGLELEMVRRTHIR